MVESPLSSPAVHDDFHLAEAALEGDVESLAQVLAVIRSPELEASLRSRGATATEATDIIGDLAGDCFGGERAKGGLHRLLGRYNGGCPLPAYFRHIAINRLISLKRKKRRMVSTDDESSPVLAEQSSPNVASSDHNLIDLLRSALTTALSRVDPDKLVVIRLIESYQIPQKQVGALLGWHESKVSRAKSDFIAELREKIQDELRKSDPWIELQWEDFIALCSESVDLFAL